MNRKNQITDSLEEKYGQEFVVTGSDYIIDIDVKRFTVHPSNMPDLSFTAEQAGRDGVISDNYVETYLANSANTFFEKRLKSTKINIPYLLNVTQSFSGEINPKQLPDWENIYKNNPTELTAVIKLKCFGGPNEDILAFIARLDEAFRNKKLNKAGFALQFFDSEGLNNLSVNDLDFFSFNTNHPSYLSRLQYYIDKKQAQSPTINELKVMIRTDKGIQFELK